MARFITAAIVSSLAVFALSPASAGNTEDMRTCRIAVADEAGVSEGAVRFRVIKGAAVKRLRFDVASDDGMRSAECKIRRGEIIDITWAS